MSRHIGLEVDDVVKASLPARLCVSAIRLLAYIGIGVDIIIFDTLTQDVLIAMFIAIGVTAFAMLVINYLAEYRDWKYKKQVEYVKALEEDAEKAVKPDMAFSKIYIITLGVSLVFVTIVSAFLTPYIVGFIAPESEAIAYFFGGIVVTGAMALYLDKNIARAVADGSFKQKEVKAEEAVIKALEDKFLKPAEVDSPAVAMSDAMEQKLKEGLENLLANLFKNDTEKKD